MVPRVIFSVPRAVLKPRSVAASSRGFLGGWKNPGNLSPLAAATLGALITTWTTFLPCFLWTFLGPPHIERVRGNVTMTSALSSVTAAVVGVVLNLAVWFGLHVLCQATAPSTCSPRGCRPRLRWHAELEAGSHSRCARRWRRRPNLPRARFTGPKGLHRRCKIAAFSKKHQDD